MKLRIGRTLAVVTLSSACSAPPGADSDAGQTTYDAGFDAGRGGGGGSGSDGGTGGGPFDPGCVLPSDFPFDTGNSSQQMACGCVRLPPVHCFEEAGPRCVNWECWPLRAADGGYDYLADGGVLCLC